MPRSDHRAARRSVLFGTLLLAAAAAGCARGVDAPPKSVVFFTNQSAELDGPARGVIQEFVTDAKSVPSRPVYVLGYAGAVGGPAAADANQALSARRTEVVAAALVAQGIAPGRINQRPRGATAGDPGIESRRVELELGR